MKLIATSSAQHRGGESGAPVKEMVMEASVKGLKVIHGSNGKDARQIPTSRLQISRQDNALRLQDGMAAAAGQRSE